MPAVAPPAKVLVTGASGFLATHIVKTLLARGFSVRGTVRSPARASYLKDKLFPKEAADGRFEFVVVENLAAPNAFDEAVKGVDAIEHVAAPLDRGATGQLQAAIDGTVGILESAKQNGPTVKRVVITSSMAAVNGSPAEGLKDTDWNQAAVDAVKKDPAGQSIQVQYSALKVLSERAAWDFVEAHKNELSFDLVTICPPWLVGPNIHETGVIFSNLFFLGPLDPKNRKTGEELIKQEGVYSDVRDIAAIHTDLLTKAAAGEQRFIACAGAFAWKDVYEALGVPFEVPKDATPVTMFEADSSKVSVVLERPPEEIFRPLRETLKDAVESARERGHVVDLS